jgi:leucyl-tRNA synthetase
LNDKELIPSQAEEGDRQDIYRLLHKTVKKVTQDTDTLNFNTAISAMMVYSNELAKLDKLPVDLWEPMVKMLSVYAPHLGEELWESIHPGTAERPYTSIAYLEWPTYDEALTKDALVTVVVQVNGKIREKIEAAADSPKEELEATALALPAVIKWMDGKPARKVITVPGKLVNIVV